MEEVIPEPEPQGSLAARLGPAARGAVARVRGWWANRPPVPAGKRDWWVAGGVAGLIAAGPVATILGAWLITGGVRAELAQLQEQAAPRAAAAQTAARDRAALVAMLRRPGLGATAEALARALPADAALIQAGRGRDGLLEIEIGAPDPDKLRAALRAEPALARLRDAGQQRGDLMMRVSFKEVAE
ncbi:hypothetical protein OF829_09320 [Sphingomonas sp. LB-2]|uniref:hypothetical protein n=1 Tax=Sphingomonas caeni TaxID=2984949 RepID=UPI0022305372|nr:hypothetical protein [Sphingomonas caeni]MCW3847442.1 hypothetical protein [Sphingomonas caeni]